MVSARLSTRGGPARGRAGARFSRNAGGAGMGTARPPPLPRGMWARDVRCSLPSTPRPKRAAAVIGCRPPFLFPTPPSEVPRVINAIPRVPPPKNEPVLSYAAGTPERAEVQAALKRMAAEKIEIPVIIGGKHVRTGNTDEVRMPHRHSHVLATLHQADAATTQQAIDNALSVKDEWSR